MNNRLTSGTIQDPRIRFPGVQQVIIANQKLNGLQHKASLVNQEFGFLNRVNGFPPNSEDRVPLWSCSGPLASGWLSMNPSAPQGAMSNDLWRINVVLR